MKKMLFCFLMLIFAGAYAANNSVKSIITQPQVSDAEREKVEARYLKYSREIFDADLPGRVVLGNPNGSIKLAEFLSYGCSHCRAMSGEVAKFLRGNQNVKAIDIYYFQYNSDVAYATRAVIAAKMQNKFELLHNAFMRAQTSLTKDDIDKIINTSGVNVALLQKDMEKLRKDTEKGLVGNFNLGVKIQLTTTPAFIFTNSAMSKISYIIGITTRQNLQKALDQVL